MQKVGLKESRSPLAERFHKTGGDLLYFTLVPSSEGFNFLFECKEVNTLITTFIQCRLSVDGKNLALPFGKLVVKRQPGEIEAKQAKSSHLAISAYYFNVIITALPTCSLSTWSIS